MKGRKDVLKWGERRREKRKIGKLEGKCQEEIDRQTHSKRNSSDPGATMHLETHLFGKGKEQVIFGKSEGSFMDENQNMESEDSSCSKL